MSDFIISKVCLIYFRKRSQDSTVAQMARCHNTGPRVYGSNPTGGLPLRLGARDLGKLDLTRDLDLGVPGYPGDLLRQSSSISAM